MTKNILLSLFFVSIFLYGTINESVYANLNDRPQPLEQFLPQIGYKTIEAAIRDFEQHFNQELKLPLRVPPITFTHQFGRFNSDQHLEITMISDECPQNHYKIDIRPIEQKINFEKYISNVFKLKNGNNALYIDNPKIGFNLLVMERDNWQYVFSIDRDVADKVTAETLIQIANTIDY
ncbi:hypothetical protein ACIP9C_14765 [Lysinibacillus sp. NPDC093210]|uniref:hypothetical protein n=1 Tax=Lysinibacillus sp. NPDC093210 TaxID=3364133 RepID=UPI00381DFE44